MIEFAFSRRLAPLALIVLSCVCGGCSTSGKALNAQSVELYRLGDLDSAQRVLTQAAGNDPENPHVYYNLARVHHERGFRNGDVNELRLSENNYNLCLNRDPDHVECYRALGVLLRDWEQVDPNDKRSDQAFTLMERWAMRSPTLADPRVEWARLHEEFNNREAAKEKLLEALSIDPNHPRALAALGRIREMEGDVNQALAVYQRSLWHDANQPEIAARVAQLRAAGATAEIGLLPTGPVRPTTQAATPIFNRY